MCAAEGFHGFDIVREGRDIPKLTFDPLRIVKCRGASPCLEGDTQTEATNV